MKVHVSCAGKLNLALNVFTKTQQFHPIDSVVVSVNIFDSVTVTSRNDNVVTLNDVCGIEGKDNTAFKAAVAFVERFKTNGADIILSKNIPVAAGMGGSSADICAVLHAMARLYNVDNSHVEELASTLGSDTVFMMRGGMARLTGRGEVVQHFDCPRTMHFAVTLFDVGVSAGSAYNAFDSVGGDYTDVDSLVKCIQSGQLEVASGYIGNGLQRAVGKGFCDRYLNYCKSHGISTCMTGSGSAFFSMFSDEDSAVKTVQLLRKGGFDTVYLHSVDSCDAII